MNIFKRAKIRLDANNELTKIAPFLKINREYEKENIILVHVVDPENKYLFDVGFFVDEKNDAGVRASTHVYDVLRAVGVSDIELGAVRRLNNKINFVASAYRIPVDARHAKNIKILNKIVDIKKNLPPRGRVRVNVSRE